MASSQSRSELMPKIYVAAHAKIAIEVNGAQPLRDILIHRKRLAIAILAGRCKGSDDFALFELYNEKINSALGI
jgi:hypothetical protein